MKLTEFNEQAGLLIERFGFSKGEVCVTVGMYHGKDPVYSCSCYDHKSRSYINSHSQPSPDSALESLEKALEYSSKSNNTREDIEIYE
jgi:hypothetical protein